MNHYHPPKEILEKYAKVLVNFALNNGKGIKGGDVVRVTTTDAAKRLYVEVCKTIWKAGGHVVQNFQPSDEEHAMHMREFYLHASQEQLEFFPDKIMKSTVDQVDHLLFILAETDMKCLEGIDPKKIITHSKTFKPWMDWRTQKENKGKLSWTIGLYGTYAMAYEAGMSTEEYWEQIIQACFLNEKDPIKKWKQISKQIGIYQKKLNKLPIEKIHIFGKDVDLWITLGEKRKWLTGGGANIPSFEIFTSPDWRGTNGKISFNQPLFYNGTKIEHISLEFKEGKVIKATAGKNEKLLKEMIAAPNADKVGEFSLTDKRFSRITKFMAETLYDENVGGEFGNTHIAVGMSYHETFTGNKAKMKKKQWEKLGYNDSVIHTDIVSTSNRTVTAYLKNGRETVIYRNGQFVL